MDLELLNALPAPWEYDVCEDCYGNNPYAIWLVKQMCFRPKRHRGMGTVRVVIDQNCMVMREIRPMPHNSFWFRGEFVDCFFYPECPRDKECTFAHSPIECDTWNFKKSLGMQLHVVYMLCVMATQLRVLYSNNYHNNCMYVQNQLQVKTLLTRWLTYSPCHPHSCASSATEKTHQQSGSLGHDV